MAGDIYSRAGVTLANAWTPPFRFGNIDKLDLTTHSGAVLVQFEHDNEWSPPAGVFINADMFQSLVGLGDIYPPGPTAVRFQRATLGSPASVDFIAYALQ
jgi:hypothetical protein